MNARKNKCTVRSSAYCAANIYVIIHAYKAILKRDTANNLRTRAMRILQFERTPVSFLAVQDACDIDTLEIAFCNLANLDGIERLEKLRTLRVHYCRHLHDVSAISSLQHLESVDFYSTPQLRKYDALRLVSSINAVTLSGPHEVESIRPLAELASLEYLGLSRVKVADKDYGPIVENKAIRRVFWHGAPFQPPALSEIKRLRPDLLIGGNGVHARGRSLIGDS
jgi:hypothetical protein